MVSLGALYPRALQRLNRRSPMARIALAVFISFAFISLYLYHRFNIWLDLVYTYRDRHMFYVISKYAPKWYSEQLIKELFPTDEFPHKFPPVIPALMDAPWIGSWDVPKLQVPPSTAASKQASSQHGIGPYHPTTPAFLMLHIFSSPTRKGAARRAFIRERHPLFSIPKGYRHLVEVKFVIGFTSEDRDDSWQKQDEVEREQETHGDLLQIPGLKNGENMNEGKTIMWMQYVGRQGAREAQWVLKCDDDAIPILPNMLPELLELNARDPAFVGTALGRWPGSVYQHSGFTYGFSWGVIKTLSAAKLPWEVVTRSHHEDMHTGEIMLGLPSKPSYRHVNIECYRTNDCTKEQKDAINKALYHNLPEETWEPWPSRDKRTTLRLVDWEGRLNDYGEPWTHDFRDAVGWHGFKSDESYDNAYNKLIADFRSTGREYEWVVPRNMRKFKFADEL